MAATTARRLTMLGAGAVGLLAALAGLWLLQIDPDQRCVMTSCWAPLQACTGDEACAGWLDCMGICGDDPMLCPTVCGAFFQAPEIQALSQCALDARCVDLDFSALPPCDRPPGALVAVDELDGFWWVSAIRGHDYVLYDDCQRFVFSELDGSGIDVANSTQVSYRGETRVVGNHGTFAPRADGVLELVYENWSGYRELYHPLFASPDALVAHVCSEGTTGDMHDYGALVLTRAPLGDLEASRRAELEDAVRRLYGAPLADFRLIGTSGCANGPEAP